MQCFATSEPYFAQEAGAAVRILPLEDDRYRPYRVLVTTQDFLTRHPEVVRGMVEASLRGWAAYLTDPGSTQDELRRLNPELNPSKMAYSWKALKEGGYVLGRAGHGEALGRMDVGRLRSEFEILKGLKLLKRDVDLGAVFYTNYCNAFAR
jgi:NitT/TauT family transport system substrate-binding protein